MTDSLPDAPALPGEQCAFEHWYRLHHQPDPDASMFTVVDGRYYWEQVRSEFAAFMGGVTLGRDLEAAQRSPLPKRSRPEGEQPVIFVADADASDWISRHQP